MKTPRTQSRFPTVSMIGVNRGAPRRPIATILEKPEIAGLEEKSRSRRWSVVLSVTRYWESENEEIREGERGSFVEGKKKGVR